MMNSMTTMNTTMTKSYSELILLQTFEERFYYLQQSSRIGDFTFNGHRYLNQMLYKSPEWRTTRRNVIIRDNGLDLGMEEHVIDGPIIIHHINPITIDDIVNRKACVFDLDNLISTSDQTHKAIHYGSKCPYVIIEDRKRNDTCPWR